MSAWFLLAIIGHLANAVAFIIDKVLLTTSFKNSATYAAMIGSLSLLAILAWPWVKAWPSGATFMVMIAFGGLFVGGLWAFFEALKRNEASRIVPIVGSLIPLFTLGATALLFKERLTLPVAIGFVLLLLATWILASGGARTKSMDAPTLALATLAAFLFAASTVAGKYVFEHADFVGALVGSRLAAGFVGLTIGCCSRGARHELLPLLRGYERTGIKRQSRATPLWAIFGQACGASGFVLIHLAIASGSAAIINALQAVQYAAIVFAAWCGGKKLAHLLKESRTPRIMAMKGTALIFVAGGLWLVAR